MDLGLLHLVTASLQLPQIATAIRLAFNSASAAQVSTYESIRWESRFRVYGLARTDNPMLFEMF